MAELIVEPIQTAELESSGYIGQPEGNIDLTENNVQVNVAPYKYATPKIPIQDDVPAVNPSTQEQTIVPAEGFAGMDRVVVNPANLESKRVTPTTEEQTIVPQSPAIGFSSITVEAAPEDTGENGLYKAMLEGTAIDIYDNKLTSSQGYLGTNAQSIFLLNATSISTLNNNSTIKSIFFPKFTIIPNRCCYQCSSLTDFIIPIGKPGSDGSYTSWQRYFAGTPVKHVVIGSNAFYRPFENVSLIETFVMTDEPAFASAESTWANFHTCVSLKETTVLESVSTFAGTKIESGEGYIYVPNAYVDEYKARTNWSVYASQIVGIDEQVTVDIGDIFTPTYSGNEVVAWDIVKLNSWDCGMLNSITGVFSASFVGFLLLRGLDTDGKPVYVAYIEVTEAES